MTREEASNVLWWASKQHYPGDQMDTTEYVIEAFDMAIAALRGPQPDSETGLVRCGCGGKARFYEPDDEFYVAGVECSQCYVATCATCDEEHATHDWNRAMGRRWKE